MKPYCILFAAVIATALPVRAIDLNAPATKQITIASEIKRGFDGARHCCEPGNISRWHDVFEKMLFDNQQRNADTDAFLLGAHFGFSYFVATSATSKSDSKGLENSIARTFSKFSTSEFYKRQRALGISDEELMKLLSIGPSDFRMWKELSPAK
jgi:hypothetical protein